MATTKNRDQGRGWGETLVIINTNKKMAIAGNNKNLLITIGASTHIGGCSCSKFKYAKISPIMPIPIAHKIATTAANNTIPINSNVASWGFIGKLLTVISE